MRVMIDPHSRNRGFLKFTKKGIIRFYILLSQRMWIIKRTVYFYLQTPTNPPGLSCLNMLFMIIFY